MLMRSDKREARRVAYPVEVRCEGVGVVGDSPLNPRISDLSVTGAFVDSRVTLPLGSTVRLSFRIGEVPIDITGEVVHEMPKFGMGIRFLDVTCTQHLVLERLVRGA